jgi:hypothetical protein
MPEKKMEVFGSKPDRRQRRRPEHRDDMLKAEHYGLAPEQPLVGRDVGRGFGRVLERPARHEFHCPARPRVRSTAELTGSVRARQRKRWAQDFVASLI